MLSKIYFVLSHYSFPLITEYHTTVARGLEGNSPSVAANPENFFRTQETDPILNGRPLCNTGPPITLYNKVFSKFLDDFSNVNLKIPSDFLSWTEELILAATNGYGDEEERNEAIRGKFSEKFSTMLLIEYGKKKQKCKSDGMIVTEVNLINAYLGILEGKNEIGTAKNDPTIQGAIYYRDYWSQSNVDQIRDFCCVPTFIIGMAGPWFCILGGVFLSRVVIQPLTDFIPLTINLRVSDQVKRISRLFYSLLLAIKELREFYHNLKQEETETEQRFFPCIRHYKIGEIVHHFTYLCGLLDDHTRTIWKAKRADGKLIVVKFASKYNIQGHNICAEHNLAPQLLYSSDDEEVKALGGFKMVIMEYICGIPLDQKYLKDEIKPQSCVSIIEDVKKAIDLLHEKDFVFGDLRAPNVLIVDTNDGQRAVLVDFDWCGKDKLDEYPSSMNKKIQWPIGAEPCALLQKEHDLYWITTLLTDYLRYIFLSFSKLA
ncbi:hypothetical protein RhiirA1_352806 [Rhizophagus irregularis]|uniref:Serine-threonine/tyrosine-protein kinase catalytic domain-containing protein n=1 Tax=Rhizophagus irregularis TaxID=588596 RepID=A0A2N0R2U9_9GLOM|nr:hypothetical protein RhiirA1_352806 [Rhizophagus irregularis]